MKIELTQAIVLRLTLEQKPVVNDDGKIIGYEPNSRPYLATDIHRDAPRGFGVKVGKSKSYIVQKRHGSKVIQVVLGKVSSFATISLAREEAKKTVDEVKTSGVNPNVAKRHRIASEITLGKCFDEYFTFLTTRSRPAKDNTIKSFEKNRRKFADWEKTKVRELKADMILKRFDALAAKARTTAEQTFRMAATCINHVIANELDAAHSEGREPLLTYNPFKTLANKEKYRSREQLEKDYTLKGFRKPLSLRESLGPFLQALWRKRKENRTGGDYWLTCFLLGTRKSEAAELRWRESLTDTEALQNSWICLKTRRVFFYDTKNHSDLLLPLPDALFELMKERHAQLEDIHSLRGQWVFPARSKFAKHGHYSDGRSLLHYICDEAEINRIAPHDARRTFGNVADELTSESMVKRFLNHRKRSDAITGYTEAEWLRTKEVQQKIECAMLATAPVVYNALLVPKYPRMVISNAKGKKNPNT